MNPKGQWEFEMVSPNNETCSKCKGIILAGTEHFRLVFEYDTADPKGKNMCHQCVLKAKEKKLK